jgi:hypothetical protein
MNTQEKTISELGKMIDVNTPIIYIHDYDFVRIDHLIYQAIGKRKVLEWNPATGTTNFFNKESTGLGKEQTLESFLYNEYIIDTKIEKFLVLKEIQYEIESSVIKTILLMMAQRRLYDKEYNTTIIIESTKLQIPEELRKYISFLEIPLPEEDEIRDLIHQHTKINHYDAFDPKD